MSDGLSDKFSLGMYAVPGIPLFEGGEDVGEIIVESCQKDGFEIADLDVVVVTQKVVSKAERRFCDLDSFTPSPEAVELAAKNGDDPRKCEAYLRESEAVVAIGRPVDIENLRMTFMRHKIGFVTRSAGIDSTNLAVGGQLLLLPEDPDASAHRIRDRIRQLTGRQVVVIISDSMPGMERFGALGTSIGFAGIRHVYRHKERDLYGKWDTTVVNRIDELAAAASMLMGEGAQGRPVVIVRGAPYSSDETSGIRDLLVPREDRGDFFR